MAVVLLAVLSAGCHTRKAVEKQDVDATRVGETAPAEPLLLLLTGTFSYDSTANAYHLDIDSERIIEGRMNMVETTPDTTGLHYRLLAADGSLLGVHHWDNPLRRNVEFLEEERFERKTIVLSESSVLIRIPLHPLTHEVVFRNGQELIKSVYIK